MVAARVAGDLAEGGHVVALETVHELKINNLRFHVVLVCFLVKCLFISNKDNVEMKKWRCRRYSAAVECVGACISADAAAALVYRFSLD